MYHVKQYCLSLFILFSCSVCAQKSTLPSDSNRVKLFPKEYGDKKWKFLFGFDARRSFLRGDPIKINGVKIGAEYKGVHRFGLGFYWLQRNAIFNDIPVNQPDAIQPPEVHFDLGYTSLFYERVFLKTRWWEVAFPVHLGGGSIAAQYRDTASAMQPLLKQPFSALLFATQIKFYPVLWLAVRVSGGYRFNFNTSATIKAAFNHPFYGFGLSINVVGLYQAIFPTKTKREEKKGAQGDEEL